jgi:uncharacterized cupin superfamily protein
VTGEDPRPVWSAGEIAARPFAFTHPFRDNARVTMFPLSRLGGLARAGVTLARLDPGRDSFPMHRHHAEEEWVYILEGRAELRVGETTHDLGPGAFAAFPAGGPAHRLTNPGPDVLVYLMGGENLPVEIVDFTEEGRLILRSGGAMQEAEAAAVAPFDPFAGAGFGGERSG